MAQKSKTFRGVPAYNKANRIYYCFCSFCTAGVNKLRALYDHKPTKREIEDLILDEYDCWEMEWLNDETTWSLYPLDDDWDDDVDYFDYETMYDQGLP